MKNTTNKVAWFVFAFLAIGVEFYPLLYILVDGKVALLASKSDEILVDVFWNIGFYGHIIFSGSVLMIG